MCKRIFRFEPQSSSYWQNIRLSRNCPKFHIFTKIVILKVYLQLFRPTAYKFYGSDMSGILFFNFASCEPLIMESILLFFNHSFAKVRKNSYIIAEKMILMINYFESLDGKLFSVMIPTLANITTYMQYNVWHKSRCSTSVIVNHCTIAWQIEFSFNWLLSITHTWSLNIVTMRFPL